MVYLMHYKSVIKILSSDLMETVYSTHSNVCVLYGGSISACVHVVLHLNPDCEKDCRTLLGSPPAEVIKGANLLSTPGF